METESCTVRPATRDEVDIAIEWAAKEGWNPGLHDAGCFHATDPGGFLIGLVGGEPVATISAVRYESDFGFIGFYIVKPDFRGRGHGFRIWSEAMGRLAGRNVGLDGVVDQQDNYRKSGFTLAYRNIRYEGCGMGNAPRPPGIVDLSTVPFDRIEAYDQPFFPAGRRTFLECWIRQSDSVALGLLRDGCLVGYGVRRKCRAGHKIGPLFADSPADAERLFLALAAGPGEDEALVLDTPEPNAHAVVLAERHGMNVVFETARMYTGPAPDLPLDRLFGVTTFELG